MRPNRQAHDDGRTGEGQRNAGIKPATGGSGTRRASAMGNSEFQAALGLGPTIQPAGLMESGPFAMHSSGSGSALDDTTRTALEGSLGQPLSSVRVHEDDNASRAGAKALTDGENIHFAPGMYNPSEGDGFRLLAHEVAHVGQQREGRVPGGGGARSSPTRGSSPRRTRSPRERSLARRRRPRAHPRPPRPPAPPSLSRSPPRSSVCPRPHGRPPRPSPPPSAPPPPSPARSAAPSREARTAFSRSTCNRSSCPRRTRTRCASSSSSGSSTCTWSAT